MANEWAHIGKPGLYHGGCECMECNARYSARFDALAVVHQAIREGGDYMILNSVRFQVENSLGNKMPPAWMLDFRARHGSTIPEVSR